MDSNTGLPPEIVFLCTTSETKEKAIQLLNCVRYSEVKKEIAEDPAVPAICCLIASEQLGNTVVSERRALQLSHSTPEQFKNVMNQVQKILIASKEPKHTARPGLTLHSLVDEFTTDQDALSRMLAIQNTFKQACPNGKWAIDSDAVQLAIFSWSCRHFQIRTVKSVENLHQYFNIPLTDFQEINSLLDECCPSVPVASTNNIAIEKLLNPESPRVSEQKQHHDGSVDTYTSVDGELSTTSVVKLEDLTKEFRLGEDVLEGMRFLERTVLEKLELTSIESWNSTLGRCVLFYWTCSVLKISGAKQITLRNRYELSKRDFDRALTALDTQRGDLRKKLESFFANNPAPNILPQTRQLSTASSVKQHMTPISSGLEIEQCIPTSSTYNFKKGTGKRGRPPKVRSPLAVIPMGPVFASKNERTLSVLCAGRVLTRSLLLLRSFNARKNPTGQTNRVSQKTLPALIALIASQQIGDSQITDDRACQLTGLSTTGFESALYTVRTLIDVYENGCTFASITLFDDMALEHGLSIDVVSSMMQVREALKASQCLSDGMEWDSALVRCSVFFWTCTILKVPHVNQNLLRSRSLSSKREFDSMLQLLNSHCSAIRYRLEISGFLIFAPPPQQSQSETHSDEADDRKAKRIKREALTPIVIEFSVFEPSHSQLRKESKRPRPSSQIGSPLPHDLDVPDGASGSRTKSDSIYVPKTQFPPADWEPLESISMDDDISESPSSVCPASEIGESMRRHTRYSTKDYSDIAHDRLRVWKPSGDEIADRQTQYRRWEEKMAMDYGPQWEKNIKHKPPGIPFE